ncbi:hypothetical protein CRM22_007788 [Opisthorchis felineus]|uniref:G-protein coupled receptors family 1 profile domain-containing protein n=1 Tax=Opisthorchis felineus TaxID=147828 RepID=A0A4S2LM26_OPIFE|nr:hypothetical protein CRM22_007788 [Opisthorchis felineus]
MATTGELVVRVFLAIFGFLGGVTNVLIFSALLPLKIGSRLTTILLRVQCVVDGYTCFMMFLYKVIGDEIHTGADAFDRIMCYIWFRDNLFWIGAILSVQNVVCISFDRFSAVLCPVTYKVRHRTLIICTFCYEGLLSIFLFLPNFFARRYADGRCQWTILTENEPLTTFFKVESVWWLLFSYILPVVFLVASHIFVICRLYRSKPGRPSLVDIHNPSTGNEIHTGKRRLAWTTVMMAATLLFGHSVDSISYLLASAGVLDYKTGSLRQQLGLFFIVLSSTVIPFVLAGSMPIVGRRILAVKMKVLQFLRQNKVHADSEK